MGLAVIFAAMLLLSIFRTRWKKGTLPLPSWLRRPLDKTRAAEGSSAMGPEAA
jgi:hypothetical protein